MEIYKLGTRWGSGQPSFYEMIKRRGIIIMDSNTANPNVGDIIVIADGYTVLAIAKVLEELRPVTEDTSLEEDFDANKIDYDDWVTFASAEWYELREEEQFQYELQKGISAVKSEYVREKITYFFDKYLEFGGNKEPLLVSTEEENEGTEISQPFDPKDVKVEVKTLSLDNIIKRLRNNRIDLRAASYQRHDNLWNEVRKSRLIESILLQLPLPVFYFDGTNDDSWEVIDGLQRLSTIKHFVLGNQKADDSVLGNLDDNSLIDKLKLKGLEYLKTLEGETFESLPSELSSRIEESNVTVYLLRPGTPEDVKFNLFQRINTGGLTLTSPEIRNALNKGIPAEYVKELAETTAFVKATNNSIPSKRMEDRDFVIRFLSFYFFGHKDYLPNLDNFLNKGMRKIKTLSQTERSDVKSIFIKSLELSHSIFGKDAFRKKYSEQDTQKKPINKALFEVLNVCFAKLHLRQMVKLIEHKDYFKLLFFNIMNDRSFVNSISVSTSSKSNVTTRYVFIEKIIQDTLAL